MWTPTCEYKYVGSPSVQSLSVQSSAEQSTEDGSWSLDLAWTHDCYAYAAEASSDLGS